MSAGSWGENLVSAVFGSAYLRDYKHAAYTFRTNSYSNAPKFKYLFHTYFEINSAAFTAPSTTNFSLLVKEVKLPSFSFNTHQLNQYNRKRIVQTKIKYDPIEIAFHDDNGDQLNYLWESYYRYYYNDGSNPTNVLSGTSDIGSSTNTSTTSYNTRNIYSPPSSFETNQWGLLGGQNTSNGIKVPFFKNITVFGFNQHNFTAYTLINPIITAFNHDTYNYAEGNGIMQNRMSIDYETVVYNYGSLDGQDPGEIVKGFGDPAFYDTEISPLATAEMTSLVEGLTGLVTGGSLSSSRGVNALAAVVNLASGNSYSATSAVVSVSSTINSLLSSSTNTARIGDFSFPAAGQTASGGSNNTISNALSSPAIVESNGTAGVQGTDDLSTGFLGD